MQIISSITIESLSHTFGGYIRSNINCCNYAYFNVNGTALRKPLEEITVEMTDYCSAIIHGELPKSWKLYKIIYNNKTYLNFEVTSFENLGFIVVTWNL